MTVQQESACKVIERCKKLKLKTVAGGPFFSCEPGKFPEVDYLILNNLLCKARVDLLPALIMTMMPFFIDWRS